MTGPPKNDVGEEYQYTMAPRTLDFNLFLTESEFQFLLALAFLEMHDQITEETFMFAEHDMLANKFRRID